MTEFLHMGGYGTYVWSSFGVATIVLAWVAITSWRAVTANQKVLGDLEARHPRRRRAATEQPGIDP
ncbi:MAG TPA: heme exporter protein CcmD [Sneathiellales bacterium]|nr:heme exporter protein CcmD [Sneathiellales bacterium]